MPGRDLSAELFGSAPTTPAKGRDLSADLDASAGADTLSTVGALGAGLGRGFGSTLLTLQQYLGKGVSAVAPDSSMVGKAAKWLTDDAVSGKQKLAAELAPYERAHPIASGLGDLGGGIAATWPVGGVIASGLRGAAAAPQVARVAPQLSRLATAIETSGLRTGAPLAADAALAARAGDLAIRAGGGAITGGASAAFAAPDHIERGAILGAALPPALIGAAKVARYGGNVAKAVTQPFTEAGQDAIAAGIIRKFGAGSPMAIDAAELVPGSIPTLAEATGNAGIATLQRAVRDLRPNAFADREAGNAAARLSAFDNIAGDANALHAATAARGEAAEALYGQAFAADAMRRNLAQSAQQMRAPFSGVGLSGAPEDLATPGLRALAQRPQFKSAVQAAKQLAANNGVQLNDPLQSLQGLHYVKLALDDALNPAATTAMGRNATAAVMGMRNQLADELAKIAPLYGNARQTFASMSQPINAMEALQGLRLTNAPGNMTLSKVKNGIEGLERLQAAPGVNPAKSVTSEQMQVLNSIHADLLRQDLLGAGKSAGSGTFQNISTGNLLESLMPGGLGATVKAKVGTPIGQLGKLAFSSSDEAIRNRLTDMMLTPGLLEQALARQPAISGPSALERFLQLPGVEQSLVRSAPVASDR
jgi:hypothetical protein